MTIDLDLSSDLYTIPGAPTTDSAPLEGPPLLEYIDWSTFWKRDRKTSNWLDAGWLARGRSHALYAPKKHGKSLFVLQRVAHLARNKICRVVYLDYEMIEDDVDERLSDMDLGEDTDQTWLRYALLPTIAPLDTAAGGASLVASIEREQALFPGADVVVVIDTTSRAWEGIEDKSDATRAFYRHAGITLKRLGVTVVRIDHPGRDTSRGMRGSSAKGDDVDIVFRLERTSAGVVLHNEASRMSWVPEKTVFDRGTDPLTYTLSVSSKVWSEEAVVFAAELDKHGIPINASRREVQDKLRILSLPGKRIKTINDAQAYRLHESSGI